MRSRNFTRRIYNYGKAFKNQQHALQNTMKRAGAKDVAPRIRGAFLHCIQERVDLYGLMEESLRDDFLATLTVISKFLPKELLVDVQEEGTLASIMREIAGENVGLPSPVDDERPGVH
jgi:hypothetical protein